MVHHGVGRSAFGEIWADTGTVRGRHLLCANGAAIPGLSVTSPKLRRKAASTGEYVSICFVPCTF